MRPIHAARTAAAASLLIVIAASTGTANAASTTVATVTQGIVLDTTAAASATCGFPIELHTVGTEISIRHYAADGTLRAESLVQHYNGYLLNPANGKTLASRVSGPVRWVYDADGSFSETSSGATTRTARGEGLVSGFIGHSLVRLVPTGELDEDGNPVYEITEDTFRGQFLGNAGICEVLA
jgi:hypothetical protein